MGEEAKGVNEERDERIIVAVTDVGKDDRGQASMIDDRGRAERIIESLIKHGVEPEAVSALSAKEVPLDVSYRWVVELVDKEPRRAHASALVAAFRHAGRALGGAIRIAHDLAPARPFELRLDRLVWVGLWVGSLLVLGVSLLASMSNGAAREVIVEVPAEIEERPVVSPTLAPPATASPFSRAVESASPTPAIGGAAREPECAAGGLNECTCADFGTQPVAQAFYEVHPPGPGQVVDPDGNGKVCEWLPER
jgi:hypothetical protein